MACIVPGRIWIPRKWDEQLHSKKVFVFVFVLDPETVHPFIVWLLPRESIKKELLRDLDVFEERLRGINTSLPAVIFLLILIPCGNPQMFCYACTLIGMDSYIHGVTTARRSVTALGTS